MEYFDVKESTVEKSYKIKASIKQPNAVSYDISSL